jgi:hypothetical protein
LDPHKSMRPFKGIFCDDISEFESYMPSSVSVPTPPGFRWSVGARLAPLIQLSTPVGDFQISSVSDTMVVFEGDDPQNKKLKVQGFVHRLTGARSTYSGAFQNSRLIKGVLSLRATQTALLKSRAVRQPPMRRLSPTGPSGRKGPFGRFRGCPRWPFGRTLGHGHRHDA